MSQFLRKLDEALRFPDRLLCGIHSSVTQRSTSPGPQKHGGSGKEAPKLSPPSRVVTYTTSFTHPPYLGVPISPREYIRIDRAREEQRQQGEYYEPIEQVGGGSVAGGGGSRQARMKHSQEMDQGGQGMGIVPMHLSELVPIHPHQLSEDQGARITYISEFLSVIVADDCVRPVLTTVSDNSAVQSVNRSPSDLPIYRKILEPT